ncbi:hypothetical protein HOY82DRAFT_538535 [Tuber indicum]|nr:hypothetical protein HOY82DRAFT_538535 [Tuber indicum]
MNTQSKRNQRKEKKENEQNQPKRLKEALKQIAKLKKQLRDLEGKYNKKRDADAKNRARVQELEAKLEKSEKKEASLSRQLEKVMEARAVPIVSAVVMKAMYKKDAGIPEQVKPADGQAQPANGQAQPADKQDGRVEKIRGLERQFLNHGYDNAQQVTEFADLPEPPSAPPVITPAGSKREVKTISAINCASTLESSDRANSLLRVV